MPEHFDLEPISAELVGNILKDVRDRQEGAHDEHHEDGKKCLCEYSDDIEDLCGESKELFLFLTAMVVKQISDGARDIDAMRSVFAIGCLVGQQSALNTQKKFDSISFDIPDEISLG